MPTIVTFDSSHPHFHWDRPMGRLDHISPIDELSSKFLIAVGLLTTFFPGYGFSLTREAVDPRRKHRKSSATISKNCCSRSQQLYPEPGLEIPQRIP
jgi:hypothetical protein